MNIRRMMLSLCAMVLISAIFVCISSSSSADSESLTVTEDGIIYTLSEGGGEYYAEATAYDGVTANIVIKSNVESGGIQYPVVSVAVDAFNIVSKTSGEDATKRANIVNITIEDNSNLSLTSSMFEGLTNLKTISIGSGITEIPSMFCYKCAKLTTVGFPDTINKIGASAFAYDPLLTDVDLGPNVENIMDAAFEGCSALTTITIPNSVTTIGDRVFRQCSSLETANLGNSMTKTGKNTFEGTRITSIYIPSKCATVSTSAFPDTLESITIAEGHSKYYSEDGVVYRKSAQGSTPADSVYIFPKAKSGTLTINHENIPQAAFSNLTNVTKITLLDKVRVIGVSAFYGCTSVEEVTMTNSVESIGMMAFGNCTNLKTITISENVHSLENATFSGCSNLEAFDFTNIVNIGKTCFQDCSKLELSSLPDTIEYIGDLAFNRCSKVAINKLPAKTSSIGELALAETGIVEITFGNGETTLDLITTDGVYPIISGSSLQSVKFDNAKTTLTDPGLIIGFADSPNLKKVEITSNFDGQYILEGSKLVNCLSDVYESKIVLQAISPSGVLFELVSKGQTAVLDNLNDTPDTRFIGWFVDSNYVTMYDSSIPLNENITVYAKFKYSRVTIDFVVCDVVKDSIGGLSTGDVVTLRSETMEDKTFNGWMINGLLLGAQYIVSCDDADDFGKIVLTASFLDKPADVKTSWTLAVTGADGKAFWTKTNEIGSYGMVTVILGEFEKADVPASAEYSVGKISDNTFMIYSVNDADITVAVNITEAAKATKYSVSLTEVAKTQGDDTVPGFKATVSAEDGYIDTAGTFLVRYVYKELDTETGLWCFTTSGQTAGVDDWAIDLSQIGTVGIYSKDMYLEKSGAYLVYGFATYAIENASVTGGIEVFTSPVIMSVSQIQAVIGKP